MSGRIRTAGTVMERGGVFRRTTTAVTRTTRAINSTTSTASHQFMGATIRDTAIARISALQRRDGQPQRHSECGQRTPPEIVDSLRPLPALWADSGPDARQTIATAIFARTDVLGFERMEYELTSDAIALGLDGALPAVFELRDQIGENGRGERSRDDDIDAGPGAGPDDLTGQTLAARHRFCDTAHLAARPGAARARACRRPGAPVESDRAATTADNPAASPHECPPGRQPWPRILGLRRLAQRFLNTAGPDERTSATRSRQPPRPTDARVTADTRRRPLWVGSPSAHPCRTKGSSRGPSIQVSSLRARHPDGVPGWAHRRSLSGRT